MDRKAGAERRGQIFVQGSLGEHTDPEQNHGGWDVRAEAWQRNGSGPDRDQNSSHGPRRGTPETKATRRFPLQKIGIFYLCMSACFGNKCVMLFPVRDKCYVAHVVS